ncbi:hypothetical protein D1872_269050 [compost metagenome]
MLFICSSKNDIGLLREFADMACQQHSIEEGDVDVKKYGVDLMILQVFQHIKPILQTGSYLQTAVRLDQVFQLLAGWSLVLYNNRSHEFSFGMSK